MRPPKRIHVGPFEYRVTFDEQAMTARCRAEATELLGHCDTGHLVIDVDPGQPVGQARDTTMHEALHAIVDLTGLNHAWGDSEEDFICRLSPAILDLLRRNPKLVAYLTADD